MSARVSEALVLRSYPFQEGDLIVSFFTRDQGKLRGVAKRARRPKSKFGAGLERLTQVRMYYLQRENRDLVNLDSCELIHSPFGVVSEYCGSVALDYITEVSDQILPAGEPNERFFRLLVAVTGHIRNGSPGAVWRAVAYFSLWTIRLTGILPALDFCASCGACLDDPESGARAFFGRFGPGLFCRDCRQPGSWELSVTSRGIAREMLRKPIDQVGPEIWTRETAADLRRYLVQRIEEETERRLVTAPVLEAC